MISLIKSALQKIKFVFIVMLFIVVFFEYIVLKSSDNLLHIYFLDVGQGDSILIKTSDLRYILIDGGPDEKILTELGKVLPLWRKKIDIVIATHADEDHIGGLAFVIERYTVGTFYINNNNLQNPFLERIISVLSEENIPVTILNTSNQFVVDSLELDILWPEIASSDVESENPQSLVLRGRFGEISFLLMADIEEDQEKVLLIKYYSLNSTILKLSHHGSKTANSEDFLDIVNPKFFIVSCGKDNKFGHPSQEVLKRLEVKDGQLLRTDQDGTIEFITDGVELNTRLSAY
jgi:competence protein ComEC